MVKIGSNPPLNQTKFSDPPLDKIRSALTAKYEFKRGNVFHFFHYLLLFSLVLRSWVTYLILDCPFSVLLLLLASIHSRSSNAFIVLRSKGLSCRTVISQSSRALSTRLKVWTCSESLWNGGRICIRLKLKIGSV